MKNEKQIKEKIAELKKILKEEKYLKERYNPNSVSVFFETIRGKREILEWVLKTTSNSAMPPI